MSIWSLRSKAWGRVLWDRFGILSWNPKPGAASSSEVPPRSRPKIPKNITAQRSQGNLIVCYVHLITSEQTWGGALWERTRDSHGASQMLLRICSPVLPDACQMLPAKKTSNHNCSKQIVTWLLRLDSRSFAPKLAYEGNVTFLGLRPTKKN